MYGKPWARGKPPESLGNRAYPPSSTYAGALLGGVTRGGDYDVLAASGNLTLQSGSALKVTWVGGFYPIAGDGFDILDFGALSGQFGALSLPALPEGLSWDAAELYTGGKILVTPEPASLALLGPGGLSVLLRRKRCRNCGKGRWRALVGRQHWFSGCHAFPLLGKHAIARQGACFRKRKHGTRTHTFNVGAPLVAPLRLLSSIASTRGFGGLVRHDHDLDLVQIERPSSPVPRGSAPQVQYG
jgi:hypothetical protein